MNREFLIRKKSEELALMNVETGRLQKDPVFHCVLHLLVARESLTYKIFFKEQKYANHIGTHHGCKEDVARSLFEMFYGAGGSS